MADISNQSDCIIKNLRSEMKGVQEKESIMGVRGRQKNLSLTITSVRMPDSDPQDGFFYLCLTQMIDPYNISIQSHSDHSLLSTQQWSSKD